MSWLVMFVCGILTALPMVFEDLFIFPWITIAVMLYIARKFRKPYLHGLVFSAGYYLVTWHWFVYLYPMDFAGFSNGMSVVIVCVAIFFMSLIQAVGTAFVPMIFSRLYSSRFKWLSPFSAAALWCLMEYGQNLFWFGVPWARLAIGQCGWLPMVQNASLLGSLFTGFVIVLAAGFLSLTFDSDKKDKNIAVTVFAAVFVANLTYGLISYKNSGSDGNITVAAIQGNISSVDKWADDSLTHSWEIYSSLTEKAVEESGAELVVWPETVITVSLNKNAHYSGEISSLAKKLGCDIAVGAYYYDELSYNSIYLYRRDGTADEQVYKKRHLVPFGEYVPMRNIITKIFPFLGEMNMFSDELGAGEDSDIMTAENYRIGALVCFDSIYPSLCRDSAKDGAEIIVVSTNDSWYKDSAAVYQHNKQSVLRAVENRRCIVRAANTGVSTVIDSNGEIKSFLEPLVSGYTAAEIGKNGGKSLYTRVGDIIVPISLVIVLANAVLIIAANTKKRGCEKDEC